MWKKFFNLRMFWWVHTEKMDHSDYSVHVWRNPFLDEKYVVFFPQDLEGNWKEMQRRRKNQTQ
jgi:hypothetical protein